MIGYCFIETLGLEENRHYTIIYCGPTVYCTLYSIRIYYILYRCIICTLYSRPICHWKIICCILEITMQYCRMYCTHCWNFKNSQSCLEFLKVSRNFGKVPEILERFQETCRDLQHYRNKYHIILHLLWLQKIRKWNNYIMENRNNHRM